MSSTRTRGQKWASWVKRNYEIEGADAELVALAAKLLDNYDRAQAELDELDAYVPGSRPGQYVANPLFATCVQLADGYARLVKQLAFPDLDEEAEDLRKEARSQQNRKNALKRYA